MATHIFKGDKKGLFIVNKKEITLKEYRLKRYNNLTQHEVNCLTDYIEANKL